MSGGQPQRVDQEHFSCSFCESEEHKFFVGFKLALVETIKEPLQRFESNFSKKVQMCDVSALHSFPYAMKPIDRPLNLARAV